MDPDLELLDRWCDGDEQSGNELFQRHFESLYRFFERKTQDNADDLVQTTLLACVSGRDRFRRKSSFRTYLFATARNILYRYWRTPARGGHELDFNVSSLAALTTTPQSRIARGEDRDRLLAALRQLPLAQQLLLELHYWEELSGHELAEVFDIAPATTRSRLFRAREALAEKLANIEGVPDLSEASVGDLDAWARALRAKHDDDDAGRDD